jgi:flagellar secretion chaperone FliS
VRPAAQYGQGPSISAMRHYESLALSSRLLASNPHELVCVLYEELGRALDVARMALAQNQPETARKRFDRARTILIALELGLEFAAGGDLARTLASIYKSMQRELARSIAEQDEAGLLALRNGVTQIHDSWRKIAPSH